MPVIVNNIFQYNFPLIKICNALVFRRGIRPIYAGLKSMPFSWQPINGGLFGAPYKTHLNKFIHIFTK